MRRVTDLGLLKNEILLLQIVPGTSHISTAFEPFSDNLVVRQYVHQVPELKEYHGKRMFNPVYSVCWRALDLDAPTTKPHTVIKVELGYNRIHLSHV